MIANVRLSWRSLGAVVQSFAGRRLQRTPEIGAEYLPARRLGCWRFHALERWVSEQTQPPAPLIFIFVALGSKPALR
jgi:hypothetical protein